MKSSSVVLAIGCALSVSMAGAGEQFLCVAEKAVGFAFDKKSSKWQKGEFEATGKYIISSADGDGYGMAVYRMGSGDSRPEAACKDGFNDEGYLECTSRGGNFRINKHTMRYIRSDIWGYIEPPGILGPEGEHLPLIEMGECSLIHIP